MILLALAPRATAASSVLSYTCWGTQDLPSTIALGRFVAQLVTLSETAFVASRVVVAVMLLLRSEVMMNRAMKAGGEAELGERSAARVDMWR
jgi:hypothetical protein